MGLFDFFKSQETLDQEKHEREYREADEREKARDKQQREQQREWYRLSDEEKGRRAKKTMDDRVKATREREKNEAIWLKRGVSVLKNRPGECFTVKRILDALPANDVEHSYYYCLFAYSDYSHNSDLSKEGVRAFKQNNTVFFVYDKQR